MSEKCQMCDRKYGNGHLSFKIICNNTECKEELCTKCFKDSILKRENNNWNCVFCNTEFSLLDAVQKVPIKCFFKQSIDLKSSKQLEEEKTNLAKYQKLANLKLREEEIRKKQSERKEKIRLFQILITEMKNQTNTENIQLSNERSVYTALLNSDNQDIRNYKCPVEDCRGFLDVSFQCPTCETFVCDKCRQIIKEDHECKKEDIETIELISRETKPCPTCSTSIQKIDGCDQMWCTQCKTVFSWNTGKISIKEYVHNPHYLEWQRRGGQQIERNPNENECFDIFTYTHATHWANRIMEKENVSRNVLATSANSFNSLWHLRNRLIIHLETSYGNQKLNNQKYKVNIAFLNKNITEKKWITDHKSLVKKTIVYKEQEKLWETARLLIDETINNLVSYIEKDGPFETSEFIKTKENIDKQICIFNKSSASLGNLFQLTNSITLITMRPERQVGYTRYQIL